MKQNIVSRFIKRASLFVLMGFSALSLSQCSLFSDTSLLSSTKDGSTYGGNALSIDAAGTNYKSVATSFDISELGDSSGSIDLQSMGTQNILVIPVKVRDYPAKATKAIRNDIYDTFFGDPKETGWESLSSYYYKSSYQQLLLQGTVTGWYDCGYTTSQIANLSKSYTGSYSEYYEPTWTLLEEAVNWYKSNYKDGATAFDKNSDGAIDCVWLVYGAPHYTTTNGLSDDFWAYTYYDYSISGKMLNLGSPSGYHYCWASYDFMYEGYGDEGLDAHTFIHETGHALGLDDYYVADEKATNIAPMGYVDMMDANVIDHDAYSKFGFGWVKPYLVSGACTITLKPSSSTGQCVILPTSGGFNGSYADEYMMLEYYTPTDLNKMDSDAAYSGNGVRGFTERGVRIYHVDGRMVTYSNGAYGNYTDTIVTTETAMTTQAHSNTNTYNVSSVNKNYRLIQAIDCTDKRNFDTYNPIKARDSIANNGTLFQSGDTFSLSSYSGSFVNTSLMNDGTKLPYTVSFSNMTSDSITLTIASI